LEGTNCDLQFLIFIFIDLKYFYGKKGTASIGGRTKNTEQDLCYQGAKGNAGQRPGRDVRCRDKAIERAGEAQYKAVPERLYVRH
jgi:hypothetical protein